VRFGAGFLAAGDEHVLGLKSSSTAFVGLTLKPPSPATSRHTLLDLRATSRSDPPSPEAPRPSTASPVLPACAIDRERSWTIAFFSPISFVSLRPSYANARTRLEADLASVGYFKSASVTVESIRTERGLTASPASPS
jgi:hypothetical protein